MCGEADNLNSRELAQWLLNHEAGAYSSSEPPSIIRVSEKLRRPLGALAGAKGFGTLLKRALTLARTQSPNLGAARVNPDGFLEGFTGIGDDESFEAGIALLAQLIGLLNTFIGEAMTLRLMQDAWPDLPVDDGKRKERKLLDQTE